jgi:AcrR family transcriptional regulator
MKVAGRPRSFDRERALDVALEHFWRNGYEMTTIATLTEAIGVSAPSVYAAFGDKERLFAETVDRYSEWNLRELGGPLAQRPTRAGVAAFLRRSAEMHTDPATPPGCFVLSEPRLAAQRQALRGIVAARIEEGLREGDIDPGTDPRALGVLLLAVITGMSTLARDGGDPAEVRAIADLALRLL